MRQLLVLLTALVVLSSCRKSENETDVGIIEINPSFGQFRVDSATVSCSNDICLINTFYTVSIRLISIDTGQYYFNIGSKNIARFQGTYVSNYKQESGGVLTITENTGEALSGHFEIRFDHEYNESFDTVRGIIMRIPIVSGNENRFGCAIGELDGITKSFNRIHYGEFDNVYRWYCERPNNERIWVWINKDSTKVKSYKINERDKGFKSKNPSVYYTYDREDYIRVLEGSKLGIMEYNENLGMLRCELNCDIQELRSNDTLEIREMKMTLYQ